MKELTKTAFSGESVLGRIDKQLSISDGSSVSLDLTCADVSVGVSPDDTVHITYYNNTRHKYEIEQSNDELLLKQIVGLSFFNFEKPMGVTVLIPKQLNGCLSVDTSSGDISTDNVSANKIDLSSRSGNTKVERISSKGDISITATAGNINLCDVKSTNGKLSVKTTTGAKIIDNISANRIDLSSRSGDTKAEKISSKGDISITAVSGNINLTDIKAPDGMLSIESSSNSKTLKNVFADDIYVDSGSGKINLEQIICTNILIESTSTGVEFKELNAQNSIIDSSSGGVRGSIVGKQSDFFVSTHVKSGKNTLPSGWTGSGNKTLNVSAASGDVKITFTE